MQLHRQQRIPSTTGRASQLSWGLRTSAVLLFLFLVSACGTLPPVAVTDPLALDGTVMAVAFPGGDSASLSPAAVPGTFDEVAEFDDRDLDLPITPGRLSNALSIATASLDDPNGPETITLSNASVEVWLWHGAASFGEADAAARVNFTATSDGSLTLQRTSCDAGAGTCTYEYAGGDPAFGTVQLVGGELGAALRVATEAPEPNFLRFRATMQGEPDTLAGHTLLIEIEAASGSVRL